MTVGQAGHGERILGEILPGGKLIGIDRDGEAIAIAAERLKQFRNSVELHHGNYADIDRYVREPVDAILCDCGISEWQISNPERGFSYLHDGPLDMRMDRSLPRTAAHIINSYSESELGRVFREYGEERRWRRVARALVKERKEHPVTTTLQFVRILDRTLPSPGRIKSIARCFMAVRIETNGSLRALEEGIEKAIGLLRPRGRICVIAYHSLEDRIVKRLFNAHARGCVCPPDFPECVCGVKPVLSLVHRRVIRPRPEEVQKNPRARSAKMRVAEKIRPEQPS
jgi:16S rRNA (cytosine1402-N4)-methyltransferase